MMPRIVDLTLPLSEPMRGFEIRTARTRANEGWNATTLNIYSHCGTHMDAPLHFLDGGRTIDQQDLNVCMGSAMVIDLSNISPRELITPEHFVAWSDDIKKGSRLLLRTDWYQRAGTASYRDELPRISAELARWLVEREVALLGVEPPSVADVNEINELTEVHEILLKGDVTIVEGLANLDQLHLPFVQLIVLPLKVSGGDGSPVRAVAILND